MRGAVGLLLVVATVGLSLPMVSAQDAASRSDVTEDLDAIRDQIDSSQQRAEDLGEQAEALAETEGSLQTRLVTAAGRAQSLEQDLTGIEGRLTRLREDEAQKLRALEDRQEELQATVAGLQRLGRRPPQALLLAPGTTHDAIRSAILLRESVPVLQERASSLKRDLTQLAALRESIGSEITALRETQEGLDVERKVLAHLTQVAALRRQQAEQERKQYTEQVDVLAKRAQGLEDLLSRLDTLRRTQPRPAPRPLATPEDPVPGNSLAALPPVERGNMRLPAAGPVLTQFGDRLSTGDNAQGVTIQTRAQAAITAPAEGRVAFADFFRNYGLLLIIEHADGYHTLLSGMESLDAVVDQWVVSGEPLGRMGSEQENAKLYVELRANGDPINPLPWFAALDEKVNG